MRVRIYARLMLRRRLAIVAIPAAFALAGCAGATTGAVRPPAPRQGATVAPLTHRPAASQRILAATITHGPRTGNEVALTLDADFSPFALKRVREGRYPKQVNSSVLDYLQRQGIPASIFVTGMWAQQYPADLARITADPRFEIENHTWNHDAWASNCYHLPNINNDQDKQDQIRRTDRLLHDSIGHRPFYFRFPGLCHTSRDERIVAAEGLQPVGADVDVDDAFVHDPSKTVAAMLAQIKPGSIVILHLNGAPNAPSTGAILRQLMPALTARKLVPVTLSQLLTPQTGPATA